MQHVSLITNENSERFPDRVKETMENYPVDAIDKIIDSMDRRKTEIIKIQRAKIEVLSECIEVQILTLDSKNRNVLIKLTCYYTNRYGFYKKMIA